MKQFALRLQEQKNYMNLSQMNERAGKEEMDPLQAMYVELFPLVQVPEIEALNAEIPDQTESDEESYDGDYDENANEVDSDDDLPVPVAEDGVPVADNNAPEATREVRLIKKKK